MEIGLMSLCTSGSSYPEITDENVLYNITQNERFRLFKKNERFRLFKKNERFQLTQ